MLLMISMNSCNCMAGKEGELIQPVNSRDKPAIDYDTEIRVKKAKDDIK